MSDNTERIDHLEKLISSLLQLIDQMQQRRDKFETDVIKCFTNHAEHSALTEKRLRSHWSAIMKIANGESLRPTLAEAIRDGDDHTMRALLADADLGRVH